MTAPREDTRYRLLLVMAGAAIIWERLWRRFWPAASWAGLFLGVSLLDILPMLNGWLHLAVLIVFSCGFGFLVYLGAAGFQRPGGDEARRRLETDSGLSHRPLRALDDTLSAGAGDGRAEALWKAHLKRMAEAAQNLRLRLPSPGLARLDPFAVRAPVVLLLAVGLAAAGGDAGERLKGALTPQLAAGGGAASLDIWITPPAYTKMAPLFLEATAGKSPTDEAENPEPLTVPAGSQLLARVEGVSSPPRLKLGQAYQEFSPIGSGGYRIEARIEEADRLSVEVNGGEIASWRLLVIPDNPPEVSFSTSPTATKKGYLRFAYQAADDYGVMGVIAVISLSGAGSELDQSEMRLKLPLSRPGSKKAKALSVHNLAAHPWAGREVTISLEAVDGHQQKGVSLAVDRVLPERRFHHPVARQIIEARKKLAFPSTDVSSGVALALGAIAARPGRFDDDTVVYLSLRVAQARLVYGAWPQDVPSVLKLLWDTALRIEDGDLSIAEQDLAALHEKLMGALDEGRPPEEIERLMDKLSKALDRYLSALSRNLENRRMAPALDMQSFKLLKGEDLKGLIDRARELMRAGAQDAARRMLSELQKILDGINVMNATGRPSPGAERAYRLMSRLRALSEGQQRLLDDTFAKMRALSPKRQPPGMKKGEKESSNGAALQEELRRELGDLMLGMDDVLGGIPKSLGKAERAMLEAAKALGQGRLGPAVRAQSEVLENLRRGLEGAAESMARRFSATGPMLWGEGKGLKAGGGLDPFGRTPEGAPWGGITGFGEIPEASELRRVREILHELRRRAGDRGRSKTERQYINRLLRRF
ncbi:MAG: DUF4175 family protein [Rhodospirillales bacterium]